MTEQRWDLEEGDTRIMCACGDEKCWRGIAISASEEQLVIYSDISDPDDEPFLVFDLPDGYTLRKRAEVEATQPAEEVVWQGEVSMPIGEKGLLTDDRKTYVETVELVEHNWIYPAWLARDKRYRITIERVQP